MVQYAKGKTVSKACQALIHLLKLKHREYLYGYIILTNIDNIVYFFDFGENILEDS